MMIPKTMKGVLLTGHGGPEVLQYRIEQGKITPIVAQTFPLEAIAQAQDVFLKKKHVGKIVLTILD